MVAGYQAPLSMLVVFLLVSLMVTFFLTSLCSHRVAIGLVGTKASACRCTRKTTICVFAAKASRERTAKRVRNFVSVFV